MLRQIVTLTLGFSLSGTTMLFAQGPPDPIQQSAAAALRAQESQMQMGGRTPPALLVPSVALLVAGGVVFMMGTRGCGKPGAGCNDATMAKGAALGAVGGVLLWIGKKSRSASPQLVMRGDKITVESRFRF